MTVRKGVRRFLGLDVITAGVGECFTARFEGPWTPGVLVRVSVEPRK